jgi:phosphopantothenoylcysteine synthetase/decarboxylase
MVWFIHDRFGMVCSTTTCSKIKRKWLKVIEAEERGEHLDPEVAQEQVRLESSRVGKRSPATSRRQEGTAVSSLSADMHTSVAMELAMRKQQQQQPLPRYTTHLDQSLQGLEMSTDQQVQKQLQTDVVQAPLHQGSV